MGRNRRQHGRRAGATCGASNETVFVCAMKSPGARRAGVLAPLMGRYGSFCIWVAISAGSLARRALAAQLLAELLTRKAKGCRTVRALPGLVHRHALISLAVDDDHLLSRGLPSACGSTRPTGSSPVGLARRVRHPEGAPRGSGNARWGRADLEPDPTRPALAGLAARSFSTSSTTAARDLFLFPAPAMAPTASVMRFLIPVAAFPPCWRSATLVRSPSAIFAFEASSRPRPDRVVILPDMVSGRAGPAALAPGASEPRPPAVAAGPFKPGLLCRPREANPETGRTRKRACRLPRIERRSVTIATGRP